MFKEHPLRAELAAELHARPHGIARAPAEVSHLAVHNGETAKQADLDHLTALCSHFKIAPPAKDATLFACDMGPFRLKWERQTEFSAYTFIAERPFERPFKEPAIDTVPHDWLASIPGQVIAALHIAVENVDDVALAIDKAAGYFDNNTIVGGCLVDGRAAWWTDFEIHSDHFSRILLRTTDISTETIGRLIQRLVEMETYRLMAMLALPIARDARPRVSAAESELSEILGQLAEAGGDIDDRGLLANLTRLAAETERVTGLVAYRFNASRAYQEIVRDRVQALREARLDTLQPAGNFLLTRFEPAMETCDNLARRLENLSARIARAGNLLRTRVDVALEEQNRDLLSSMDKRAQLQLRLQQTVEGLSVAAISYYVISLVIYLARGAKSLGVGVDPYLAGLVAFPLVFGGVWWGVRHVRKSITKKSTKSD